MTKASIEVTGIKVRKLIVPLRRPLKVSFGTFTEAPMLAVELETKGGTPGRVLGFTFHKLGLTLLPPVLEHLAGVVKGRSIARANITQIHDLCQKSLMLLGHEGVTQMALSFFDMALHDAVAREAGLPLYRLLGAERAAILSYNSCGGSLIPAEAAAKEAKELIAENGGFGHVKIRLGRSTIAEDLEAVKAVREALGPNKMVSVDFNQALPASTALDVCRAFDSAGLGWIEEPVTYDDYETQTRLTSKLSTPVQIGETWWHWRVAHRAIQARASDYIMPDILRIGGVTGWMRVAQSASIAGIPMSSHLSPEFSAHMLAATPTRGWLEFMDWGQELLEHPVIPEKGIARPSDKPGAGMDFREAVLAKHIVS